jgi:toxin YoeB
VRLIWTDLAWEDYEYWLVNNKDHIKKINKLIKDIKKTPFTGLGKPEPLRYELTGCWSRHINLEHRLVYKVEKNDLCIIQCRFHYKEE